MLLEAGAKRIAATGGPVAGQCRCDDGWGGLAVVASFTQANRAKV